MRTVLSKRLQMLADMVTPGNRLVDVGCDHGFLDIYLVQEGICPGALAMDVREGPLGSAGEHIRQSGLGDYIEIRISDGLRACGMGEAETLVCAGMGGRLMERILREGIDKARGMKELILQPQSELPEFRAFLKGAGFTVVCEDAVCEEGKYYFAMKAVYQEQAGNGCAGAGGMLPEDGLGQEDGARQEDGSGTAARLYDLFGEHLLKRRHPVLGQYLRHRRDYLEGLKASMEGAGTDKARGRVSEIGRELEEIGQALLYFGREGCT